MIFFKYLQFERQPPLPTFEKKKISPQKTTFIYVFYDLTYLKHRNGFMVKILSKILQIIKWINDPTLETEIRFTLELTCINPMLF